MPVKKKRTTSGGLTGYRRAINAKTKREAAAVKKAESALKMAKKKKAAAVKKATAAYKKSKK